MKDSDSTVWFDRRELIKGAIAGAGALALPAATRAQEGPRKGGRLRLAIPYNPAALDPMTGRNLPDLDTLYAVFDALIDFVPETLELKPGLAKSWSFTDPKTLVLELVDGVNFHDGTPFNAEAVKFNLDRYKNDPRSNVKADMGTVESIEVTGKSQVTLKLNRPNAGLPAILTNRIGLIVSPKSIQDKGGNVDRTPVGTGPFKFVSWQDNSSIVLNRNENYWREGLPYLDGIDMRIINELNTAVRAVVAGEADLAINLQAPQKVIADRSPNVIATAKPSLVLYGAFLNYGRPPLDDVRVRQALNYAINRDEINKIAGAGLGQVSSAILPQGALGLRSGDAEFLYLRSGEGEEAARRGGPSERAGNRDDRLGRSARHAAPGDHYLPAREDRHPRQAGGACAAAGDAGLHDGEEGGDVPQSRLLLPRSQPGLRGPVRRYRVAQCQRHRAAGLPRAARHNHGVAGPGRAQRRLRQAAALRRRAGDAARAVHFACGGSLQPQGAEFQGKHDLGAEADRGLAQGMNNRQVVMEWAFAA